MLTLARPFIVRNDPVKWFWVFVHEEMRKFVIYSDDELDGERRWALQLDEG